MILSKSTFIDKILIYTRPWALLAGICVVLCSCSNAGEEGSAGLVEQDRITRSSACAVKDSRPVLIKAGQFAMGSSAVYSEEGPVKTIMLDAFRMDPHEVTNEQFAQFVREAGYVTTAELPVDPKVYSADVGSIPSELLLPGSAVFRQPTGGSPNDSDWWEYRPGANWKMPYGPDGPAAVANHPVVHLSLGDMQAYADWKGGLLPTEAQWEYAARAGGPAVTNQPSNANTWQGVFPIHNEGTDGFEGIAPVGCFEPNAWGLYDMIGNVWEMTNDLYLPGHDPSRPKVNPRGPSHAQARNPANPAFGIRVIKGGSYLCAPNYCRRYRAEARSGHDMGLGTSNVGFRLIYAQE
ncbi:formylglycine-generating enzyme family protein [Erythrobacter sp. NFXS35]|uniref:formylglycine-generating enzyme family protein n=1 Tax=Erythrobacter sp. NFXS35 TaxID=2818436 RepID=UPI0032DEDF72